MAHTVCKKMRTSSGSKPTLSDRKRKMNKFKKFEKTENIFRWVAFVITLAVLVYLVTTVLTSDEFDSRALTACIVFAAWGVTVVIFFLIFDAKRNVFVAMYFGRVSPQDMAKARDLLPRLKTAVKGKYAFLGEEQYQFDVHMLKCYLKQIAKGNKVYYKVCDVFIEIDNAVQTASEKDLDENAEFNDFFKKTAQLLRENSYGAD